MRGFTKRSVADGDGGHGLVAAGDGADERSGVGVVPDVARLVRRGRRAARSRWSMQQNGQPGRQ